MVSDGQTMPKTRTGTSASRAGHAGSFHVDFFFFLLRIFLRAAKQHRQHAVLRGCVNLHPVRQQIHKREVAVIAHGGIKKLRHIHRALLAVQRPLLDLQRQRQRGVVERRRHLTHPAARTRSRPC